MPTLYTAIEIDAPKERVWKILFHKEKWLYWNTFLYDRAPQQPFEVGQEVFLSLKRVPGAEEVELQPVVTLVDSGVCLQWFSQMPGFQSEHVFELQDIGNCTKYIHQEHLSGWLTRLTLPWIRQEEQQGLRRMSRELKRYAEQRR